MSFKVKDTDRGWKKHGRAIKTASRGNPHVTVGVQGPEAAATHSGGAVTNIEVASTHEFGLGNMPERSYIRASFDVKEQDYKRILNKLAGDISIGKISVKKALDVFGLRAHADTILFMRRGIAPDKVGGNKAQLKDTGDLYGSITFVSKLI